MEELNWIYYVCVSCILRDVARKVRKNPKTGHIAKGELDSRKGIRMAERRKFTPEFKARVVLEMLTEQKSAAQSSRKYGIKDSVLSRWKQEFIERSPTLFEQGSSSDDRDQRIAELERMIGRLTLDLDMAKKVSRYLNSGRNGSENW